MRILFVSTWASNNGLSRSTVHPHLDQLATYDTVEQILYISIEPAHCNVYTDDSGKVRHAPVAAGKNSGGPVSRTLEQLKIRQSVLDKAKNFRPDIVICRGAPAGALGSAVWRQFRIPYFVESFEPHAEYMVESAVWKRWGIKYLVQKAWEARVKRTATRLITVSEGYAKHLQENEWIAADRLRTVPCWVDEAIFHYDRAKRQILRDSLNVGDSLVCTYLGQFGGLYYDDEAFKALRVLRDTIGRPIHFLLLSPTEPEFIESSLSRYGISPSEHSVLYADYTDVPGYLSAADFAIAFHRAIPMAFSYSPVKYGEYWSCGLPVIAPHGVGDDSGWIDDAGLGCTVNFLDEQSIRLAAKKIVRILDDPDHREAVRSAGRNKRSKEKLIAVYEEILESR